MRTLLLYFVLTCVAVAIMALSDRAVPAGAVVPDAIQKTVAYRWTAAHYRRYIRQPLRAAWAKGLGRLKSAAGTSEYYLIFSDTRPEEARAGDDKGKPQDARKQRKKETAPHHREKRNAP